MPKPTINHTKFDANGTNAVEPVNALKDDGYATNAVPTSANINWQFWKSHLWFKWIDDGAWEAVTLLLTGLLTGVKATFTRSAGELGATVIAVGAAGVDGQANAAVGQPAFKGTGGDADEDQKGGAGGEFTGGAGVEFDGDGGAGVKAKGGAGNPFGGGVGGYGVEAEGGLATDGTTYRAAVQATNGDIVAANGAVTASKTITASLAGSSLAIPARTTPALSNGWANVGGSASTFGYWKDAFGVVHLDGTIDAAAASASTIHTLPAGSRPPQNMLFTSTDSAGVGMRVSINTAGAVQIGAPYPGTANNFNLDGITFRTT